MTSRFRRVFWLVLGIVGTSFALTLWHLIWQFWWPLKWQSVKVNGALMSKARIYRRTGSEDLMLYIPPGGGTWEWYVIRVSDRQVGWVADNRCWFVSPRGVLTKDHPDPSVDIAAAKMNKHDPQLQLSDRSADFVGLEGEKIRMEW